MLAYPQRTDRGAAAAAVAVRRGGARWRSAASGRSARRSCSGPAETLQSTFRLLRDELLTTVAQVGGRLGELRFDTDLDVSHAVVRYLELLKLAALLERTRAGGSRSRTRCRRSTRGCCRRRPPSSARSSRRARSTSTCSTPSATRSCARGRWRRAPSRRWRRFLPRRGDGLLLSASDIETYRTCPLKYKFARVFRIPSEPTINQRFGILVHQVLERYHAAGCPRRPARAARPARGGLAARRLRRLRGGAPAAREGHAGARALPRPLPRGGRRAGLVRALVPVPPRPAPAARARGPRRPAPGRRLRADRLQDRPPEVRGAAARGRAALALRGRRARGVAARGRRSRPTTTCSTTRRCPSSARGGPRLDHRHRARGRPRGSSRRASSRRRASRRARCATTGSPARRPSASRSRRRLAPSRAGAGSAGTRGRARRPTGRSPSGPACSSSSAARSRRSTNACTSGSSSTARVTWRS